MDISKENASVDMNLPGMDSYSFEVEARILRRSRIGHGEE
jgi:hypothetical protein